jgi:hypothetical protein
MTEPEQTAPAPDEPEGPPTPEQRACEIVREITGDLESDGKPSQATRLVELARRSYRTLLGTDGKCYAVPLEGAPIALPMRGENGLRTRLARAYFDEHKAAAGASAIADALTVLEGQAADTDPEPVALRIAEHDGSLVLDLGTTDGRAVVVRPDGWEIVDTSPVLFRRTRLTSALPTPQRTAPGEPDGFAQLHALLNVSQSGFRLLVAWLVAALFPEIAHPILSLYGEQGTAKSTTGRLMVTLVDPSPAPLRAAPRDLRTWHVQAAASWTVMLDNVSTIPQWFSDTLCKAVTGDGVVERQLYSDDDVNVLSFRRVIGMTTIDAGALKGDLGERMLMVELDPIPPEARRTDDELQAAFEKAAPAVLGAVLDLTAQVLAALPAVAVAELPRLADFAKILAAVDQVRGWSTFADFTELAKEITEAVIEADPFADAVRALIHSQRQWSGTAGRLLEILPAPDGLAKTWPKTARGVSGNLRRVAPALRKHGIGLEFSKSSDRLIHLRFGSFGNQPPNRPGRPESTSDQH